MLIIEVHTLRTMKYFHCQLAYYENIVKSDCVTR